MLYCRTFSVKPNKGTRHGFTMKLDCDGQIYEQQTDHHLSVIMAAFSAMLKAIAHDHQLPGPKDTVFHSSAITLDEWTITPTPVWPLAWVLTMTSGPYTYTAQLDHSLESVLMGMMGAMKFFGLKYKITTLDDEVIRRRDEAKRLGLTNWVDDQKPTHEGGTA